jgi:hypothetical protein
MIISWHFIYHQVLYPEQFFTGVINLNLYSILCYMQITSFVKVIKFIGYLPYKLPPTLEKSNHQNTQSLEVTFDEM